MRTLYMLSFILFFTNFSDAQSVKEPQYIIVRIGAKTVFSKPELNKKISGAVSNQQVKEILWSNPALQDAEIQIRIKKGNDKYAWWRLNKNKNIDKEGDWILTQSKGIEDSKIYSTNELKSLFKGTLAIIDTLKLRLFLQDENLPIDKYYVVSTCKNNILNNPLAYNKNLIVITRQGLPDCANGKIHVNLHNELVPHMYLGECDLLFIDEDIKTTLKELAISLMETDNKLNLKDIVNYMSGYVEANYGKVSRIDLKVLLNTVVH